ncbi:shikimate kinase [Clostridium cavendishii DSM 21758]|uniref:Shikimate kinase n=1 Tax=Clostridium cavendishii DSM 21758 TaxID=1121302 RepID=A0A1M6V6V9_9CLOT|nr:AAA family ATPase [Clostridium cavendishii]SHK77170.1 shikimate kinase [Clostridium cavendishii DSM 21758]
MKKLIIINGVMGVGKTTISKDLYKNLENSFWLDGDNVWLMNPFVVNEENKKMVIDNISFILNNFLKNSSTDYVVFNWVIHSENIMKDILQNIKCINFKLYKITLMCSKETLINRIENDINEGLRDEDNIRRSLEKLAMYENMDTIKIDTTNKDIDTIVEEIKKIVE